MKKQMKKFKKSMTPYVAVDAVVERKNKLLLIQRSDNLYGTKFAFPGGFVKWGETVESAAVREVEEETGAKIKVVEILGVYSHPERDKRGHVITIPFVANFVKGSLRSSKETVSARWMSTKKLRPEDFSFDHGKIFSDYLKWRRHRGTFWSTK